FRRIRSVFRPALIRDRSESGDPSPVSIFIVGMPRSGSTLVEQILASHPSVFGAGELRAFPQLVADLRGAGGTEFPEPIAGLSHEDLTQLGQTYLRSVRRIAPDADRITDKMPGNFMNVGLIHLALPHARIIHTCRDPRDIALSCFSTLF